MGTHVEVPGFYMGTHVEVPGFYMCTHVEPRPGMDPAAANV